MISGVQHKDGHPLARASEFHHFFDLEAKIICLAHIVLFAMPDILVRLIELHQVLVLLARLGLAKSVVGRQGRVADRWPGLIGRLLLILFLV